MSNIFVINDHELTFLGQTYHCAIGANGFTATPKEGDKATPLGSFFLRECWYRADRISPPVTSLPLRIITQEDGWCDDPKSSEYNTNIKRPSPFSHEELWREDHTYDIMIPIGFNDNTIVPGLGSAIMFHIAKPEFTPTLGCVAVSLPDMLKILRDITTESKIVIEPNLQSQA
jgi:L,D-peptidoglycan transpeptidase YkuD (ErfK/YbiS/YcfS/YnhG family)